MRRSLCRLLVAVITLSPFGVLADGLSYVKQVVYGMDCAPCAYGVEQGLKKLAGVETVKVSLNEGFAELTLGSGSPVTLADIREVVLKNGFTPKGARVSVSGIVKAADDDGGTWLEAGGRKLRLSVADARLKRRLADRAGRRLTVTGTVSEDAEDRLSVESIGGD